MKKKIVSFFLAISLIFGLASCTTNDRPGNNAETEEKQIIPSIAGLCLGDSREKVLEILGMDYTETIYEEAEHFPEKFANWEYADGFIISIGQETNTVLQIMATSPSASTNLGIKVGDSAEKTLNTYRTNYPEPESIHGGKLYGVFKVEKGQALIFDFNIHDGIVNPQEIDPAQKVERIILTYPSYLDDSF
ncbi:MAG: hypothetical protein GXW85_06475 [Clostridia bacterium]|nr:hypothetical protein [Clostridia bacterium]